MFSVDVVVVLAAAFAVAAQIAFHIFWEIVFSCKSFMSNPWKKKLISFSFKPSVVFSQFPI